MVDKKKAGKVVGGIAVAGGLIALFVGLRKKAEASPGPGGITITLYDQNGNVIGSVAAQRSRAAMATANATEGDTISAVLRVANTSYQVLGGVETPVAATLSLKISALAGPVTLIPVTTKAFSFAASEIKTADKNAWSALQFAIPVGAGGQTGNVSAQLLDPAGNVLASGQASFSIAVAPIVYGGTVIFQ